MDDNYIDIEKIEIIKYHMNQIRLLSCDNFYIKSITVSYLDNQINQKLILYRVLK